MKSCLGAECGTSTAHIFIPPCWFPTSYAALTSSTINSVRAAPYLKYNSMLTSTPAFFSFLLFFPCCNSSTRGDCRPCVVPCRRHCWQTDTNPHADTSTHIDTHVDVFKLATHPPIHPCSVPREWNPDVKCWESWGQDEKELMFTVHVILSEVWCICQSVCATEANGLMHNFEVTAGSKCTVRSIFTNTFTFSGSQELL